MQNLNSYKVKKLKAIKKDIIVTDMYFGERFSQGGILLRNDDSKSVGIRPRWAQVYAVGPEVKDVEVGQYVCVSHGRWTRGISIEDDEGQKTVRKVDPKDILLVSDEPVIDYTMSDKEI